MSISKEDYDSIMRRYDQIQMDVNYELNQRLANIYQKHPDLKENHDKLASLHAQKARYKLLNRSDALIQDLDDQIKAARETRSILMKRYRIHDYDLQPHYFCPDCKDTGFIFPGQRCHCFTRAITSVLSSQSNLQSILKQHNFSTFNPDLFDNRIVDPSLNKTARQNILEAEAFCKLFVREFDTTFRNILFYGGTGVGKTFLTNCIAKELLDASRSVLYLSAIDFSTLLTDLAFRSSDSDAKAKETAHYIFSCDLLIIDDLGTEVTNSLKSSNLFNCLDKRLTNRKSTIISTNLSPELITRQYSDRVFSRILGNYACFKLIGDDIRTNR